MATKYWVGGTGTWDSTNTANWSLSSGGAGGVAVPNSLDTVVFDSNSGTGTVTTSGTSVSRCRLMQLTYFPAGLTLGGTGFAVGSGGGITVDTLLPTITAPLLVTGGATFSSNTTTPFSLAAVTVNAPSTSSIKFICNINMTSLTIQQGSFQFYGGYTTAVQSFTISGSGTKTIDFLTTVGQTPTINFSSSFSGVGSSGTTSTGTFTMNYTGGAGTTGTFGSTTGVTYTTLNLTGAGTLNVVDSVSVNRVANPVGVAAILRPNAGTTFTTNDFALLGSSGNVVTLSSYNAGSQFTLSQPSGTVNSNYLAIKDCVATGGANFFAGLNSTDNGNNSGWQFGNAPKGHFFEFFKTPLL